MVDLFSSGADNDGKEGMSDLADALPHLTKLTALHLHGTVLQLQCTAQNHACRWCVALMLFHCGVCGRQWRGTSCRVATGDNCAYSAEAVAGATLARYDLPHPPSLPANWLIGHPSHLAGNAADAAAITQVDVALPRLTKLRVLTLSGATMCALVCRIRYCALCYSITLT